MHDFADRTHALRAAALQKKYDDLLETVSLMLASVGYTEQYALQWSKEKASVTFKRWFDEQMQAALVRPQPPQPLGASPKLRAARVDAAMEATKHVYPPLTRTICEAIIHAALAAVEPDPVTPDNLVVDGRYNWQGQQERLVFVGRQRYTGDPRVWFQFALTSDPYQVWCEVLAEDLTRFERTKG